MQMRDGPNVRAVAITCASSARPASKCNTLGKSECMRLPWPAARMTTLMAMVELSHKRPVISALYAMRHIVCNRLLLHRREMQGGFGAPIQNILCAHRPFTLDHVIDFARIKIDTKIQTEVGCCAHPLQYAVGESAVAPRERVQQRWRQRRIFCRETGVQCAGGAIEVTARQWRIRGPCHLHTGKPGRELVERVFGQPAISRDLAA